MNEMEMNILSRLALLKVSRNVNGRFNKAKQKLEGDALLVAQAIEDNDRTNRIAKSLLEWAESELSMMA